jgi:hypothetical protein
MVLGEDKEGEVATQIGEHGITNSEALRIEKEHNPYDKHQLVQ